MATKYMQAKNRLDKACREYIKARDGNRCIICGGTYRLAWGHFISKHRLQMRWNELNVHAQCMSCNWAHVQNCVPYVKFMIDKYGVDIINQLQDKWKVEKVTFSVDDLDCMTEYYKNKLKKLKEGIGISEKDIDDIRKENIRKRDLELFRTLAIKYKEHVLNKEGK
jgi:Zn-finger protein